MASPVTVCRVLPKRFIARSILAYNSTLNQPLRFGKREIFAFVSCDRESRVPTKPLNTTFNTTKRKFSSQSRTDAMQCLHQLNKVPIGNEKSCAGRFGDINDTSKNNAELRLSSTCNNSIGFSRIVKSSISESTHRAGAGVAVQQSLSDIQRRSFLTKCSTQRHWQQLQCARHFSSKPGGAEDDENEMKDRLRGAVVYLPNPFNWFMIKRNTAKLRKKFDPTFSENEFLDGAKQAIAHVMQLASAGKFESLAELAEDEVIAWLALYRHSLSVPEQEALALDTDDIVFMKVRSLSLDTKKDKALAFVDAVCFGLKFSDTDKIPYLLDMEISFKRDYSSDPPGDWVMAGVSHIRMRNMTPDKNNF